MTKRALLLALTLGLSSQALASSPEMVEECDQEASCTLTGEASPLEWGGVAMLDAFSHSLPDEMGDKDLIAAASVCKSWRLPFLEAFLKRPSEEQRRRSEEYQARFKGSSIRAMPRSISLTTPKDVEIYGGLVTFFEENDRFVFSSLTVRAKPSCIPGTRFPKNLKRLAIMEHRTTSLHPTPAFLTEDCVNSLPKDLRSTMFLSTSLIGLNSLPPHLETLIMLYDLDRPPNQDPREPKLIPSLSTLSLKSFLETNPENREPTGLGNEDSTSVPSLVTLCLATPTVLQTEVSEILQSAFPREVKRHFLQEKYRIKRFPESLTELKVENMSLNEEELQALPQGLQILALRTSDDLPVEELPTSLQKLDLKLVPGYNKEKRKKILEAFEKRKTRLAEESAQK